MNKEDDEKFLRLRWFFMWNRTIIWTFFSLLSDLRGRAVDAIMTSAQPRGLRGRCSPLLWVAAEANQQYRLRQGRKRSLFLDPLFSTHFWQTEFLVLLKPWVLRFFYAINNFFGQLFNSYYRKALKRILLSVEMHRNNCASIESRE